MEGDYKSQRRTMYINMRQVWDYRREKNLFECLWRLYNCCRGRLWFCMKHRVRCCGFEAERKWGSGWEAAIRYSNRSSSFGREIQEEAGVGDKFGLFGDGEELFGDEIFFWRIVGVVVCSEIYWRFGSPSSSVKSWE